MGASEKNDFGLKLSEGKRPLSYQAYKLLSTRFLTFIEHIATHAFLVLEWNLIATAENCVGGKIDHTHFHREKQKGTKKMQKILIILGMSTQIL